MQTKFPLINAVLEGLQEGKIFKGPSEGLFFVAHKAGFSYLTGSDNGFESDVFNFCVTSSEIERYIHVYDAPISMTLICKDNPKLVNFKTRRRIQLKYVSDFIQNTDNSLPYGFSLRKIDNQNFDSLAIFKLDLEMRFWNSKNHFIENGFGYFIVNEHNSPVSICYTACVSNNTVEIDIMTLPAFQQMGLGKHVVSEFVRHCTKNDFVANWDCFEDNFGSLRTAESIGFKRTFEYSLLSIYKI